MMKEYLLRGGRLLFGMLVSAVGIVMMIQANIGVDPWNVFHQGLHLVTGISLGKVTIIVGAAAILISMLLGERIGIGTVANITITGLFIDAILYLGLIPLQIAFLPGLAMLLAGLELLTIGTWQYMSAQLGTGPRDALNVALARKTRLPVGGCRSGIELLVTLVGWLLGGQVGVGTLISALGIGLLIQLNFAALRFDAAGLAQENLAQTWCRFRKPVVSEGENPSVQE